MRKTLLTVMALLLVSTMLFAGGDKEAASSASASSGAKTEIYFLNFKPEVADVYTNVVKPAFEAENPEYTLKVETAASNQYASTLRAEMAKAAPPVIFQVNGPVGIVDNVNDVAELKNTDFYKLLGDKSMALSVGNTEVAAIPYAVEGYGIIYNQDIMDRYFKLADPVVKSMDEVKSFDTLKKLVEDMTKKKSALGIQGVFASTSFAPGNDWRWQTHLFNMPLYAEMIQDDPNANPILTATAATEFDFDFAPQYKQIFDLYLNNSTTEKGMLGSKSVDDSMAEFSLGQAAMVQNGNWGASQILGLQGNKVAPEDIKFLPLYVGLAGEENQGLDVGTENYLVINKNASEAAQKGADVFLTWLFSSPTGKQIVNNDLGFITPFNSFSADEMPSDPLAAEVVRWMNMDGITSVPWTFAGIPSEEWKNAFGAELLKYINGTSSWDDVVSVAQTEWAKEAQIAGRK